MKIKLKDILDSKDRTVYSLAKATGISQNNLSKLIKGDTISIRYDSLEKICNELSITPNDIFDITNKED